MYIKKKFAATTKGLVGRIVGTRNVVDKTLNAPSLDMIESHYNGYSTEEKIIGKWFNGQPIYRKIIQVNLNGTYSSGGKTYTWINPNISNLGIFLKFELMFQGVDRYLISSSDSADVTVIYSTSASNHNKEIQMGITSSMYNSGTIANLILEYTKTTD